jgi:hypothetical protein
LALFHLFLLLIGFLSCCAALGEWQVDNKKPIVEPKKTEPNRTGIDEVFNRPQNPMVRYYKIFNTSP